MPTQPDRPAFEQRIGNALYADHKASLDAHPLIVTASNRLASAQTACERGRSDLAAAYLEQAREQINSDLKSLGK